MANKEFYSEARNRIVNSGLPEDQQEELFFVLEDKFRKDPDIVKQFPGETLADTPVAVQPIILQPIAPEPEEEKEEEAQQPTIPPPTPFVDPGLADITTEKIIPQPSFIDPGFGAVDIGLPEESQEFEIQQRDERSDIPFIESLKGTVSNIGTQLQNTIPRLNIVAADVWTKILGKELATQVYSLSDRDIVQVRTEALTRMDELASELKGTRGIVESIRSIEPLGFTAAVIDSMGAIVATAIPALLTGGATLFTDPIGQSIVDFNKAKAEKLNTTTKNLYETDRAEFGTPAILGTVMGSLERIGLKGITKVISRKILKNKIYDIPIAAVQEGATEWAQLGLEEFNRQVGGGKSFEEGVNAAGSVMASEEGVEVILRGVFGSAGAIGAARAVKGLFSKKPKKPRTREEVKRSRRVKKTKASREGLNKKLGVDPSPGSIVQNIIDEQIPKLESGGKPVGRLTVPFNKMFNRFADLNETSEEVMTIVAESDQIVRREAVDFSLDFFKELNKQERGDFQRAYEDPVNFTMPKGRKFSSLKISLDNFNKQALKLMVEEGQFVTEGLNSILVDIGRVDSKILKAKNTEELNKLEKEREKVIARLDKELETTGFPFNQIKGIESTISELNEDLSVRESNLSKLKSTKNPNANHIKAVKDMIQQIKSDIEDGQERVDRLKQLNFVKRITIVPFLDKAISAAQNNRVVKKLSKFTGRSLSKKPVSLYGRKFPGIKEVEESGREVEDIITSMAQHKYEVDRMGLRGALIRGINKNKNFSAKGSQKREGWVRISEEMVPGSKFRIYHPAIANAIENLLYVKKPHALTRAYDTVNTAGKIIGFYNPVFMTGYNIQQGFRGVGLQFFKKLPNALLHWSTNSRLYQDAEIRGLFNNPIDWNIQLTKNIAKSMISKMEEGRSTRGKRKAIKYLKTAIIGEGAKDFYAAMNAITWNLDRIARMSTLLSIMEHQAPKKGSITPAFVNKVLSLAEPKFDNFFQMVDFANDIHASYNKIPTQTRQNLNRLIFTPTYKLSMFRLVKRMLLSPKQNKAPLARQALTKLFFQFALPSIVGAVMYDLTGEELEDIRTEKGYQIVGRVKGTNKEKVYSVSGPFFEVTKIVNRALRDTANFNLAFLPHFIVKFLSGSRNMFPGSKEKGIAEYFKLGVPLQRDLELWQSEDKKTFDKWLSQLGTAFVFYRRARSYNQKVKAWEDVLVALDVWADRKSVQTNKKLKTDRRNWIRKLEDYIVEGIKINQNPDKELATGE